MVCPKCGGVLPEQTEGSPRFCVHCGASIDRASRFQRTFVCVCGVSLPDGARFCPSCGKPREASEELSAGINVDADLFEMPTSAKSPKDTLVTCPKCSAKVKVTQANCTSCGTQIDPMLRFKELMTACRAQKMPIQEVRVLMQETGLAKPTRKFGCLGTLLFVGFWWLMGATAFAAGAPGTLAWTAPLLCPEGYTDTVIPVSVSSYQGKTSMSADLYCIDKDGFAVEVSPFKAFPLVGLFFAGGALALIVVLKGLFRVSAAMRPAPRPQDARRGR